ncbi:PREDICTED: WRKY transcription factor 55 [Tarenaya hassleriana]|uniref:WRKY transcription factor 55 n=1 Tax=Tarenaya hassleriana TaxID=28532 RepID=UPI00053C9C09|nr:PREDICTED: WRKY transcription factor 55 [Tarenaya hassleriana]
MEEIMPMIFHGFELVKDLESSLPEKPPESLSDSLDSISKTFGQANDRLKNLMRNSGVAPDRPEPAMPVLSGSDQMLLKIDSDLLQEYWSRPGASQSMDAVIQTQLTEEAAAPARVNAPAGSAATEAEVSVQLRRTEPTDSGGGSGSSTPRPRRRNKEDGTQQTVLVAAPRMGNTEVPPDDNYTWRKYGQKEILGAKFPRAYYRCTHQKLYNCPATKQVQRLDHDPFTFRVTYRGSHTCHISPTAPVSSAAEVADMATAMFSFPGGGDMGLIFPAHGDCQGHNRIQ